MFITGRLIIGRNLHSIMQALVMWAGVAVFFPGLVFFIIDTQPQAIWVTVLSISARSYLFSLGVQYALEKSMQSCCLARKFLRILESCRNGPGMSCTADRMYC